MDAAARPTPGEMLKHPWIIEQQAQKANMEKWIAQVWGWEIPTSSSSSHHHKEKRRKDKKKHNSLNGCIVNGNAGAAGGGSSAGSAGSGDHRALMMQGGGLSLEGSSGGSLMSPDSPRPPF